MAVDILDAVLDRLSTAGVADDVARKIVSEIRREWGGEQVYVRAIDRASRDRVIREALRRGASKSEAARAASCSLATVRRRGCCVHDQASV